VDVSSVIVAQSVTFFVELLFLASVIKGSLSDVLTKFLFIFLKLFAMPCLVILEIRFLRCLTIRPGGAAASLPSASFRSSSAASSKETSWNSIASLVSSQSIVDVMLVLKFLTCGREEMWVGGHNCVFSKLNKGRRCEDPMNLSCNSACSYSTEFLWDFHGEEKTIEWIGRVATIVFSFIVLTWWCKTEMHRHAEQ